MFSELMAGLAFVSVIVLAVVGAIFIVKDNKNIKKHGV